MQTKSTEHEDITKLLHDAFVRICQLAIADCGVSVAELTLYLSVQLNTGVPQILSTTVVETVRSPLVKDNRHAECSATSGPETVSTGSSVDGHKVDSDNRDEKESFASECSFDRAVHVADVEPRDFIGSVTVGSLTVPPLCTSSSSLTTANDSLLLSRPLAVNSINNLLLAEDSPDSVQLEELLANVGKSSDDNNYVSQSPGALIESVENTQEADIMRESSGTALLGSEDSLVPVNGACVLSTLQSYNNSDMLTRCTVVNCVDGVAYDSSGQSGANNSSFLQDCHFVEDDTPCSDSSSIAMQSPFRDLCEFAERTPAVDKVSGHDSSEVEADGLSTSQHSSKTADRSAREGDTSYDEELVVDESSSCSDCHTVAAESSSVSFNLPVSKQPICTEAVAFIQDVSPLKPYPVKYTFSNTFCPNATDSAYSRQPNILSFSNSSYGLLADNIARDVRETEFSRTSAASATVVSVSDANRGKSLHCFHLFAYFNVKSRYTVCK